MVNSSALFYKFFTVVRQILMNELIYECSVSEKESLSQMSSILLANRHWATI